MNTTLPSAVLVRVTHMNGGEPAGSITLDNSRDIEAQRNLWQNVRNIVEPVVSHYGMRQPGKADHVEILTGRTANQLERMEGLLNDCRNLLIDIDEDEPEGGAMRQRIDAMLDKLDAELGL